jgi:PAS domain S-box-containing protein
MSGLRFLLLEDSLLDVELIHARLTEGGIVCHLQQVKTRIEFQTALEQDSFDLILSDYSLPGFDGITALEIAQRLCPDTPFLFVTATMDQEVAIETLKNGATDYILKQRLERLVPSTRRALREAQERQARKKAEAELHRREQEFRALVENSPNIIARIDRSLRCAYVNPVIEQAAGIPPSMLIGKTMAELGVPEEIYAPWEARLREVFVTGIAYFFEFDFQSADGTRSYQSQILPEFAIDGSVETLLSITSDITVSKETEQALRASEAQLRQQKEELEKANQLKDEFLAVLSHELRSPLNAILGWSKILRTRKLDTATFERALETIERNAKLQTQLIEDLLDVSRIIRGKLTLHSQPTSLVPAIEAAIDTMRLAAQAKSIDLQFKILDLEIVGGEQENPRQTLVHQTERIGVVTSGQAKSKIQKSKFRVLGDPNRLQQIIWNLVSNAIKFTPEGGRVEVQLSIQTEQWAQRTAMLHTSCPTPHAQITVKDTGIGISPHFLPYVFDSFRQADGSTTRKQGGLGLGLAIVRHLVELHGGTVVASSLGEGQGATFAVNLPLLVEGREWNIGIHEKPSHSPLPTPDYPLTGKRILVVDDDSDSRDFLQVVLEECGAEATAVSSASKALEVLVSFRPDLLLSDIGMPEQDGYTLIRQVRTLPPALGGGIPAIALTAYASEKDRQKAFAAGFQKHLSKPIVPDQLIDVIVELVGHGA